MTDSYKNVWNNCEISVSDEKRQILEWLSPLAPWERHRAVSEGRLDGVGGWLLGTSEFEEWHRGGSGYPSCVILSWGFGGGENIPEVGKQFS